MVLISLKYISNFEPVKLAISIRHGKCALVSIRHPHPLQNVFASNNSKKMINFSWKN